MERSETIARLRAATTDEIRTWAGESVMKRGIAYARERRVQDLAHTPDGWLLAWVDGGDRYATLVGYDEGFLSSCTCPYGAACKHAVATLVAFQNTAAQGRSLPEADEDDDRILLLEEESGWEDEDEDGDEDEGAAPSAPAPAPAALRDYLAGLGRDELAAILGELAARIPEVRDALESRQALDRGDVGKLLRDTRRMLAKAAPARDWDDWGGGAEPVDYEPIRDRLRLLLRRGHADAVADLGDDLLRQGTAMVEEGYDEEGELAEEIAETMSIVFQALAVSDRPADERMLKAIDWVLADGYGLTDGSDIFWEQEFAPEDWSAVADVLLTRLPPPPPRAAAPAPERRRGRPQQAVVRVLDAASWTDTYRRDRLSDRAIMALERAGRQGDALALAEREAEVTGSYVRLVRRLLAAGRRQDAEPWIARGIAATEAGLPGIAAELRRIQRELWREAEDWPRLAALDAESFFRDPSLTSLHALRGAAERLGVWPAVRAAALRFLETGEPPQPHERAVGGATIPPWPLPPSGLPNAEPGAFRRQFPALDILIALAIEEGRPDEVLRWYDRRTSANAYLINHEQVAAAVEGQHPDRAAQIWRALADSQIAQTNARAYEAAAGHLRRLRALLERSGRADEWRRTIAGLRAEHRRKRRLLEELDALERGG